MRNINRTGALGAIAVLASAATVPALARDGDNDRDSSSPHAVFVMTNDADANEVVSYERTREGTLGNPRHFDTGGRGSGGTVDPLASQGSLTLSDDGNWLLAANAGSGTISLFRVFGARLLLTDRETTAGAEPNAVAQHGKFVYVMNTAGSSSVIGFRLDNGRLNRIPDSQRLLSGNGANPASIAFSADGRFLVVTERANNSLDVFRVQSDGRLSPIVVNPSAAPGVFSATVSLNNTVIVSETGPGTPQGSTVSSYSFAADGKLVPVNTGVPSLGDANCWNVVTPDGRYVYAANSASNSIAGYRIGAHGELALIGNDAIVARLPAGSANIDIAVSKDGRFLYTLNGRSGTVSGFAIQRDGSLASIGERSGLPAAAGLNGIAAN